MEQDSTKINTFFRFEDLRVYHKALEYIDWVFNNTMLFTGDHLQNLSNRFNTSAQAIAFYIAEGSSRNKSQFIYYLKLAKSSVRECVVVTSIAQTQNLLTDISVEESRTQLMELTKMIGALIGSLQKSNSKGRIKGNHKDYDDEDELIPADSMDIKKY
ncbi:MAG: four helix bundle protein [Bacteroidales bacterium]|nr:four helix bundle protein [Bacteroidales bacterium]